jgi:hypothetical protein
MAYPLRASDLAAHFRAVTNLLRKTGIMTVKPAARQSESIAGPEA